MNIAYKILGFSMILLAALGVVLPVLPTTPFLLVAVWAFGRSSERMKKWLLNNKLFGVYLRNYRSGRGVPLKMRAWTIALLWVAIGLSAWRVNPLWLKVLLPCISVAVTVHVWRLGRRRVLVLVPTEAEAKGIEGAIICGVGMAETAAAVVRALRQKPRMLILAGVAGAIEGLRVGDCVAVSSERVAGLPVSYNKIYNCPWVATAGLPLAVGVTVSEVGRGAMTPDVTLPTSLPMTENYPPRESGSVVENMEGAAFFSACQAAGVRFLEIRAVSNTVGDQRENWRVEEAVIALAIAVERIINSND